MATATSERAAGWSIQNQLNSDRPCPMNPLHGNPALLHLTMACRPEAPHKPADTCRRYSRPVGGTAVPLPHTGHGAVYPPVPMEYCCLFTSMHPSFATGCLSRSSAFTQTSSSPPARLFTQLLPRPVTLLPASPMTLGSASCTPPPQLLHEYPASEPELRDTSVSDVDSGGEPPNQHNPGRASPSSRPWVAIPLAATMPAIGSAAASPHTRRVFPRTIAPTWRLLLFSLLGVRPNPLVNSGYCT
jgi:hypothetical protein